MRQPARRKAGTSKALVLAVLVHVLLLAALLVSVRWSVPRAPQPVMQAVVVEDKATARPQPEEARRREEDEARRRAEQDRRAAEQKRREEDEARQRELKQREAQERRQKEAAEQKRKLAAEEEARKRKAEEESKKRKAEDEAKKRKAEEDSKRAAEQKRRQDDEARRKQAEQALKEQLAAEESEREQAARAARAQSAIEKYKAIIRQRVERNWIRPIGAAKGLSCVVQVKLVPGGEVVQARVVRSSGDAVFDRSVENAVFKSTPLPLPPEKDLFDYFREIEFLFSPES